MAKKLWGGRFKKRTDPDFERFSSSYRWDGRLLPYDLKIDAAHVRALKKCGVLSAGEATRLLSAVTLLKRRYEKGALKLNPAAEDVHSVIQAELEKLTGPLADKLHTARSRNDLVSQSSRLYCLDHSRRLLHLVRALQKEAVRKADQYKNVLVPGMTHLQNAQILSQGHIFLAYAEMLERAAFRLEGAIVICDVCVLGSGALAGVTFPLDQKMIARELGLSKITSNSYDAVGERDFIVNLVSSILLLGTSLSRIAEDLLIAQVRGVKLIEIDEAFCTGSSMMPQKKNADFLELVRGAAGIFFGNFIGMLTTVKGLPTSYNRDLQWDKKFLFDSVENSEEILGIFIKVFRTLKVNEAEAKRLLADDTLYATDLADSLVKKGVPFKLAHEQVGRIVSFAEERGLPVSSIGLDLIRKIAPKADGGLYGLFDPVHSISLKRTAGSTHPAQIKNQIRVWKKKLNNAPV
ncbi:MAG: argininosuccinate lyase [Candidatus Omnitrophota bacterium]